MNHEQSGGSVKVCSACIAGGFPDCCSPAHTPSVVRLAEAISKSLMGPPAHTELHPEWYIEDAEAIAEDVEEGDGWNVEHDDVCLGEFFKVNGVEFYIDINAEGYNPPMLAAEIRAERSDEEAEEDTQSGRTS